MTHPDLAELAVAELSAGVAAHLARCPRCRADRADLEGDGSPPPAPPRYRFLAPIGRGGMGEVHRAWDEQLGREVALKVLRADRVGTPAAERFVAEARLTASLQHPAIVPIHEIGALADGRPYFTMQEVRGPTLRAAVARGMPVRRAVEVVVRIADAVAYAHDRGVVHRDLKPDNVLVGNWNDVVVADWGLAGPVGQGGHVGTPPYRAPERGAAPAADVFALGVMLAEIVGDQAPAALRGIATEASSIDPGQRPTAHALSAALRKWLDGDARAAQAADQLRTAEEKLEAARGHRTETARLVAEAVGAFEGIQPHDAVERKRAGWALEDAARDRERDADDAEADALIAVYAALHLNPSLPDARRHLARVHWSALDAADARSDDRESRRRTRAIRSLGEPWSSLVDAPARVRVDADRPAEVILVPHRLVDRYPEVDGPVSLGPTPLSVEIPPGRHHLRVVAPGRADAVFPILVRRDEECDLGRVHLPEPIAEACYVPAGVFAAGGDPAAVDSAPAQRVAIGGFFVQRDPVTLAGYVAFLNECGEGERWEPREARQYGNPGRPVVAREGGKWVLRTETTEIPQWEANWPVVLVSSLDAEAYAEWLTQKTGFLWSLPHDLEWEKAARGLDGRAFPWGDLTDPSFSNMGRTLPTAGQRLSVSAYPKDCSPYGVRGLGGNVRDWCCNEYRRGGDGVFPSLPRGARAAATWRLQRGGSWMSVEGHQRCASRFVGRPDDRNSSVGFRLVCRLEGHS